MPRRLDIDWDDVDLGDVTDTQLAAELQVSTRKVQMERCARGIPPAPKEDGIHRGINWDKEPLGKMPDDVLAKNLDVDPGGVGEARRVRGIPPYTTQKRDARLAGKTDACIDQALLLTPSQVPDNVDDLVQLLTANGWSVIFTPE